MKEAMGIAIREEQGMAFDAFVKINGIDGESTDEKYTGWIEVLSCDAKVTQKISHTVSSSGGAGAEQADFSDFRFIKQLDKASPKLAVACAAGTHIDSIAIEFCRSGTAKFTFMQYKLTNCMIRESWDRFIMLCMKKILND